jgi:hypothetical protein
MKYNVGSIDRRIRFGLAILIMVLYYYNIISGILAIVLIVAMGIFLVTSYLGFCPLYLPFGINTTKKKENKTA